MKPHPSVYIIILNWNNPNDTIECVGSVKRLKYPNFRVLLVDNGSTDGSADILRRKFPDIDIIENSANYGYVRGNNIGIRRALDEGASHVFILNNDTTVGENALDELMAVAVREKAILSPKVYYYDRPRVINSMGTSMNWFRLRPYLGNCGKEDRGQFSGIYPANILVGCALLISREIIEDLGLFDESFYMIHEDADLCLRNIKAGNKNLTVSGAVIYHKASATLGKRSAMMAYYSIRNLLYLAKKHASLREKFQVWCGLSFLIMKNGARLLFVAEKRKEAKAFFMGVNDYLRGAMGERKEGL
jgi:GT2 family glycosyltransferase